LGSYHSHQTLGFLYETLLISRSRGRNHSANYSHRNHPAKGKYKGRKSSLTNEQMQEMKVDFNNGMKKTEIAEKYGVTRSYVYQLVKKNHHGLRVKF
jgi:transposase